MATVSKVIHGHDDVGAATKQRVNRALRDLDYTPVGRPDSPRVPSIVAAFDHFGTVYETEVLAGIMRQAIASSARVVVDLSPGPERAPGFEDWVLRHAAAGVRGALLVTSRITSELVESAERHGVALVAVDPKTEAGTSVTTIGATNWAGTASATDHLLELGHTRIAFAGMDLATDYAAERFAGYRSSLERAGITVDSDHVGYGGTEFEDGQRIGTRFATLEKPPTAVVAVSDGVALGLIEAARAHGLSCPDDISVVGFDDVQPARWSTPLLTTVRQPLAEMGALAIRSVLDLIDGKQPSTPHIHLATSLIVRDSTRRVGAARSRRDAAMIPGA